MTSHSLASVRDQNRLLREEGGPAHEQKRGKVTAKDLDQKQTNWKISDIEKPSAKASKKKAQQVTGNGKSPRSSRKDRDAGKLVSDPLVGEERLAAGADGESLRETSDSAKASPGRSRSGISKGHLSVMLKEVLAQLDVQDGEQVVDGTAGEAGHSYAILQAAPKAQVLALDADPSAVTIAREKLSTFGKRAEVVEANFGDLGKVLKRKGLKQIHKALFDLGWNSGQLSSGRGFSFSVDEPLDMSYGKKSASGFTAAQALNEWDEETLANVFYGYGEERYARRIAKAVIQRRAIKPIATTVEFVEIIRDSTPAPYHHGRIHFATRTFQALRMAVNDELGVINTGITAAWDHLAPGGRIAVITFHSIEDRAVKRLFLEFAKAGGRLITKKPLVPSQSETRANPRARSAKLRVIEKTS